MLASVQMRSCNLSHKYQLALRLLAITSIVIIFIIYTRIGSFRQFHTGVFNVPVELSTTSANDTSSPGGRHEIFWQQLLRLFKNYAPDVPKLKPLPPATATAFANQDLRDLPNLISLKDKEVMQLKDAHTSYVRNIMGRNPPKLVYEQDTKGIVTTASGRYLHFLMVSLRMLRRTGCLLPVEVFVERSEDFKSPICEAHLPALGARCFLFAETIGDDLQAHGVTTFQLKIFAILLSSFEDVLFLDADNLAIHDPFSLLTNEPFITNGLVIWPDFWAVTASPVYFNVSSQDSFSPLSRPSSESGQLLVSKKQHAPTLVLAAYYNFYGPTHYYPLLSQGGAGQGDKDTYCAAAMALKASFHAVQEPVSEMGHLRNELFRGIAMAQHSPTTDTQGTSQSPLKKSPTIFVHHHNPKLDPLNIFNGETPTRAVSGKWQRMWGSVAKTKRRFGGLDIERRLWQELCIVACAVRPDGWGSRARKSCDQCKDYTRVVFGREGAF